MRPEVWLLLLVGAAAMADDKPWELGGHTKLRFIGTTFPSDSVFRQLTGKESLDLEGDLRLNFAADPGRWTFSADYQLIGLYGDRVEFTRDLYGDFGARQIVGLRLTGTGSEPVRFDSIYLARVQSDLSLATPRKPQN